MRLVLIVIAALFIVGVLRVAWVTRGHLGVDKATLPVNTKIVGPASIAAKLQLTLQRTFAGMVLKRNGIDPKNIQSFRQVQEWGIAQTKFRQHITTAERAFGSRAAITYALENARDDCLLFSIHGGGYISGHPLGHYKVTANFMEVLGCDAVAPFYGLAPEKPYPHGIDDIEAIYKAVLAQNPGKEIYLMGESAGGGLALALMLRLRSQDLQQPKAAFLLAPWTDLTDTSETLRTHEHREMLPVDALPHWVSAYAAERDLLDPDISPLYGDHSSLPPTLILVGTDEVQLGDSIRLQERFLQACVRSELQIWRSLWHVWLNADPGDFPEIEKTKQAIAEFVQTATSQSE